MVLTVLLSLYGFSAVSVVNHLMSELILESDSYFLRKS